MTKQRSMFPKALDGHNRPSFVRLALGLALAIVAACAPLPRGLAPDPLVQATGGAGAGAHTDRSFTAPRADGAGLAGGQAPGQFPGQSPGQAGFGPHQNSAGPEPAVPGSRAVGPDVAAGTAEIHFTVTWPERPRTVAVLPLSTNALVYEISSPDLGVISGLLGRQSGVLVSTQSVVIEPQSELLVSIRAYAENPPCLTGVGCTLSQVIAQGSATASAPVNQRVTVPVTLAVPAGKMPSVTAISPANGGPGANVSLTVTNVAAGAPLQLLLGAATSSAALSGSTVTTAVPTGAVSGTWSLTADGVTATPSTQFKVLTQIAFGSIVSVLRVQIDNHQFTAVGTTTEGATISDPAVAWSIAPAPNVAVATGSQPPATAQISEGGYVHDAPATGSFWIYIYSGSLSATSALTVVASDSF